MQIAFIGFGEVAGAFAPTLVARGCEVAHDILIDNPEGVEKLRVRPGASHAAFGSLDEVPHGYVEAANEAALVAMQLEDKCVAKAKRG